MIFSQGHGIVNVTHARTQARELKPKAAAEKGTGGVEPNIQVACDRTGLKLGFPGQFALAQGLKAPLWVQSPGWGFERQTRALSDRRARTRARTHAQNCIRSKYARAQTHMRATYEHAQQRKSTPLVVMKGHRGAAAAPAALVV